MLQKVKCVFQENAVPHLPPCLHWKYKDKKFISGGPTGSDVKAMPPESAMFGRSM